MLSPIVTRRKMLSYSALACASLAAADFCSNQTLAKISSHKCSSTGALILGIGDERDTPSGQGRLLQIGETAVVRSVDPQCKYYPSQVIVEPSATYQFDSTGYWKDGILPPCGPDGWPGLVLQAGNRLPWRRFFLLCGCLGMSDQHAFGIGTHRVWTAPAERQAGIDHQLFLFANDWPLQPFLNNNREINGSQGGPLRVTIRRLS